MTTFAINGFGRIGRTAFRAGDDGAVSGGQSRPAGRSAAIYAEEVGHVEKGRREAPPFPVW